MPNGEAVPDIYTDLVNVLVSDWGVSMGFRRTTVPFDGLPETGGAVEAATVDLPTDLKAVVRMSHSHAKALTIQMRKLLKRYEEKIGKIEIPGAVMERLGIQREDW